MFGRMRKSHKFSRSRKSFGMIMKYMLTLFGVLMLNIVLFVSLEKKDDDGDWFIGKDKDTKYVRVVTKPIEPLNTDGTPNGLNLLLISKLSEGYIKDYLQTCVDNQNGKFNDYQIHLPMEVILSIVMTEQGGYEASGGVIPVSMLPWDSSNNSPLWKKDYQGIPADALTLQMANKNVFASRYGYGSGTILADPQADAMSGGTYGPFQITPNEVEDSQKSKINGYNSSDSRGFDDMFMPDQLSHLDSRMETTKDYFNLETLTDVEKVLAYSFQFNPGVGNIVPAEFRGCPRLTEERNNSLKEIEADMNKVAEKYSAQISTINNIPQARYAAVCIGLIELCDWKITQHRPEEMGQYVESAWNVLHPENPGKEAYSQFMSEHSIDLAGDVYQTRRIYTMLYKKGTYEHYSDTIALGHAFCYTQLGGYLYARLLKLGGLEEVDPTNPSTYMNLIKQNGVEGEWTPSGDLDWLKEVGADTTKIGPNRMNLLNNAHTRLGVPYVWGGTDWDNGMDCSGFVQEAIRRTFGITVGRSTYDQVDDPNFDDVPYEQALPGDIVLLDPALHHVVFFLKDNDDGTMTVMHEPRTGDVCKIARYSKATIHSVRRYKDLEDSHT